MNQAFLHRLINTEHTDSKETVDLDKLFERRLGVNITLIKDLFFSLYPEKNHAESFKKLVSTLPMLFKKRPKSLKLQDLARLDQGNWYQSQQVVGMQLYVDHFSKDLQGLSQKLDYFEKLGVNFLHLMPITTRPKGENDGGYAVNSYHEVDKRYGTKKDLLQLTDKMRGKNMLLMLDFVANHTSNEFSWAKKAKEGDLKYQNYYHVYQDRVTPDEYEKTLPEIFPLTSPGNFTYDPKMKKWVMTVFNEYQWDLNYSNPEVFIEMLINLLKLVNHGVDVVRLDALAFMWKQLGTLSQNLPKAHDLICLFRMCLQVVAPGVIFLAEAIVAPKEIIKYFGTGNTTGNECEIAYNATLMALLWDAVATKKTTLLYKNLQNLPQKPIEATWINYIRCHDDIGLGFDDNYINEIGWNAETHRKFLLDYYCQNIEWSPAKGAIFMYNPKTGDGRITGNSASLLGLEKALEQNKKEAIQQAIDKIIMLHGIIISYGGIPLIYAGDEIGMLNDYSYLQDSDKKEDSRWINRPYHNWKTVANLKNAKAPQSQIFFSIQNLIRIRKNYNAFADSNNISLFNVQNPHIFCYERTSEENEGVLALCNFAETPQFIEIDALSYFGATTKIRDLISEKTVKFIDGKLQLKSYQLLWLVKS